MQKTREFNLSVQVYRIGKNYEVVENCNSITVTNVGDAVAEVNGMILNPGTIGSVLGDSRTWAGHAGEVYKGRLEIKFSAGATPAVEVIQKYYI